MTTMMEIKIRIKVMIMILMIISIFTGAIYSAKNKPVIKGSF